MPKHLAPEVREAIKLRLVEGKLDHLSIADDAGVSLQSVKNYSANLTKYGSLLPPSVTRHGRKPLLNKRQVDVCDFRVVS